MSLNEQESPARADALVGREASLEAIGAFLSDAIARGDALLVIGAPGVGKTALLDAAAEAASAQGAQVLRADGVEFEAEMPFAALTQLLLPLLGEVDQLGAGHRDALNVALGLGSGRPPERMVAATAVLALLRHAAGARPVAAIVDDLQWVDRTSAGVLGFVARRLEGSRVAFVGASRLGEDSFFERVGLAEHELQPLTEEAAGLLLDARHPELATSVRNRVLAESHGYPLALLELPAALSSAQRSARAALPDVLPPTRRLQQLFASRLAALPTGTRRLLLLNALGGTGDLRILNAAEAASSGVGDLAPALHAGLVTIDRSANRLAFRHPLIRSTVVELSAESERLEVHALLAEVLGGHPERRAWHLAEATLEPDEEVAGLLEHVAHRILERGDGVGAVTALTRASALSPEGASRSRRLAEAAFIGADVTGELLTARARLADAREADPENDMSLRAAVGAAYVLINADGDVDTAHRLLVAAIEGRIDGWDDERDGSADDALLTLAMICFFSGRAEMWEPFYAAIERLGERVSTPMQINARTVTDPIRSGPGALKMLEAAIADLSAESDPAQIARIGLAAIHVDRVPSCRDALTRLVDDARAGGAIASGIQVMGALVWDDFWAANWDDAAALAREGVEVSESLGYAIFSWPFVLVQAMIAAARGDRQTTGELCDAMLQWATPRKVEFVRRNAWEARALDAVTHGEFEEAFRLAGMISSPGSLASHVLHALYVPLDLVEAALRTGRRRAAVEHVAVLQREKVAELSPRLAQLVGACAAMVASDERAVEIFEETIAIPDAARWGFDHARIQLLFGERLRRAGARAASRGHLTEALETFRRLGAAPWMERAAGELRAGGLTQVRGERRDRDALTPQEHEIARLAAAGLSNKQIAERLFLSPRTVGGHLYRVFPKLGVTSRAALSDALAQDAPEPGP